jgi:hypothetical protein
MNDNIKNIHNVFLKEVTNYIVLNYKIDKDNIFYSIEPTYRSYSFDVFTKKTVVNKSWQDV